MNYSHIKMQDIQHRKGRLKTAHNIVLVKSK